MTLLDYENQMFLELFDEDGLVVMAKGLGIERLLINLIKTYNDPGNLVLVIGTTSQEEEYISNRLLDADVAPMPKTITSEFNTKERYEVYMEGGVLFVSTRILVVDMLVERLPIDLVTGIIVYRAHKILDSCQEAFILRLYRMKNKKGFVKAVTSNPCAFTRGFNQVQRVMRNLFVGKMYLWPRFHLVVCSSMNKIKPEVCEIHVAMTHPMQSIQIAILDLINVSVKELKKINPTLDTDELTVENAIAKSFDKIVKYQLDPVWHQLSSKTKRLVSDLKTLRSVLKYLTQYDCITFYKLLKSIKENVTIDTTMSDWLFLDASDNLFVHAEQRIFGVNGKREKARNTPPEDLQFDENPKWKALCEILSEISNEAKDSENIMVVIVVENEVVSKQLQEVLSLGSNSYLLKLYRKLVSCSSKSSVNEKPPKIKRKKLEDDEQTLTQMMSKEDSVSSCEEDDIDVDAKDVPGDESILKKCANLVLEFYPLQSAVGSHFRLENIFQLHSPKYIIMYDGDLEVIRRIELYQCTAPELNLKVYFLIYKGSAEEQCYLTTLRREKEAFEFLIKEKAHMVLPEGIDGKMGDHPDLERGSCAANETVNARKAGGQLKPDVQQRVIVDMREFRSELPSLIHRRGIDVIPVTLEVGDYILTPETCVERKSVSDLIGSLNSGRLYTQAQSMCRLYKRPILLIEFDQNKAFSLQGKYYTGGGPASQNITSKLILLTCHFPTLRILWCASPYATAEMFELLKLKKDQPDVQQAVLLKPEGGETDNAAEKFNSVGSEFVSKLPGLNSKNMWPVMNGVTCIADLIKYSEEELGRMLGNSVVAKTLWDGIHKEMKCESSGSSAEASSKKVKKHWKNTKKSK